MDKISVPRSILEHGDEEVIDELQTALNAAEENCAGGTCTLPETQHLQVRVSSIIMSLVAHRSSIYLLMC